MTQKMPLSLTIKAGGKAKLKPSANLSAPVAAAPVAAASVTAASARPKAPAAKPHDAGGTHAPSGGRAAATAALLATYAALLGVTLVARDLSEQMDQQAADADIAGGLRPEGLAQVLQAQGLTASVQTISHALHGAWPALALMSSGQFLLVLAEEDGALVIYDKSCPDNRARVALAEFEPFFTGTLVCAEARLEQLSAAHGPARAAPHWFWGAFGGFKRAFGEIVLGSFVANLLAVAVALFSLQVYDRVIPHQSEATLWVLAAGAALAIVMEALLKISRARLMDGAGRQIELGVQGVLMNRLLGMRSERAGQEPSQLFSAMREFGAVREFFTASTVGALADIPFIFIFLLLVASIAGPVVWVLILGGCSWCCRGCFCNKR